MSDAEARFDASVRAEIRRRVAEGERCTDFDTPAPNAAEISAATKYAQRPITSAECYELAGKSWMPATASEAPVRAARTIAALANGAAR